MTKEGQATLREYAGRVDTFIWQARRLGKNRLNRVGVKLGLVVALLMGLFMAAALISFLSAQDINQKVREVTEVEEPTSAAAYEMEINVIGTGMGVLQYLQIGDAIYRQRVAKDEVDFERFKVQYDGLAETTWGKDLGSQVSVLYEEYKALGDGLMDQADERENGFVFMAELFEAMDSITDDKFMPSIDIQAPDAAEIRDDVRGIEASIGEMGTRLSNYLWTHNDEHLVRFTDDAIEVREHFADLNNLRLTEEQQDWLAELEDQFEQGETSGLGIIAIDDNIGRDLAMFLGLRAQLDDILDDELQVLTRQDLAEATTAVHQATDRTNTLVLVLLLVGIVTGTISGIAISRGITKPIGRLVSANRKLAEGDLSQRVIIRSTDEFGILGDAFN